MAYKGMRYPARPADKVPDPKPKLVGLPAPIPTKLDPTAVQPPPLPSIPQVTAAELPRMLVVARDDSPSPADGTVLETRSRFDPNYVVRALTPLKIIGVRVARSFLQNLVTGLGVGGTVGTATGLLPLGDFTHAFRITLGFAVTSAAICALQNFLELFKKLDESHPEWRG